MSNKTASWRPDIQGLRAVAVGLVFASHAAVPGLDGGFIGVDVFFVISGFLITSLLIREHQRSDRISIANFYARRARRILPAATLTLAIVLIWSAIKLPAARVEAIAEDGLWSAFFLANVHFASVGTDYFAETVEQSPFQHYWSLAVEEQFYLVWPLLIGLLLAVVALRWVRWILAGLVALSLVWSMIGVGNDPGLAYFSSFGRAFELGVGGVLAFIPLTRLRRDVGAVLGVVSAAVLVWAALTYDSSTVFPGAAALVPVLATAGLLAAGMAQGPATGVSWLLGQQPLRYLGDISFSLYLWHWPMLVLSPTGNKIGDIALAFVFAAASYHLVEQRATKFLSVRPMSRSLTLWPAALALVVVSTYASTAYAHERLDREGREAAEWFEKNPEPALEVEGPLSATTSPALLIEAALKQGEAGAPIPQVARDYDPANDLYLEKKAAGCAAQGQRDRSKICPVGDLDSETTIVLFGDSHANTWLETLRLYSEANGIRLVPFLKLGCAPFEVAQLMTTGAPFDACASFRAWASSEIIKIQPDAIVFAARGMLNVDAPKDAREQAWADGVDQTLTTMKKHVENLLVVSDYPIRDRSPLACLTDPSFNQADCTMDDGGGSAAANRVAKPVVDKHDARWIDTSAIACFEGRCPLVVGESVLYRDHAHLSPAWLRLNQAYLLTKFGEQLDPR